MSSTPRILVVVATKHGATAEIGRRLAADLSAAPAGRRTGLSALALPARQAPDPAPFDAVVLGSAVYAGSWLDAARDYATHYAAALRSRLVWLFSSGPIGDPPHPPDEPYDISALTEITGARGHRVFPGRVDLDLLGPGERAMVTAMRAPVGDFRDWAAVTAWAAEIATTVAALPVSADEG
jgi:menaquinone-dependent protoporphyrinogen oxidase